MKKDELCYSANHTYRDGYNDGFQDGKAAAYDELISTMKDRNYMVWSKEFVKYLQEVKDGI